MDRFFKKLKKKVAVKESVLVERVVLASRQPEIGYVDSNKIFLDAANCRLNSFDLPSFVGENKWGKLTHLYLARNELIRLPEDLFKQATSLMWLDVRWNDIMQFPTSVRGHASLKTLLLQNNNIERLPIELGSIEHLHCLSVTNNPLEFPSKDVLSQLRSNEDLINYLKRCWNEQSADVIPVVTNTSPKRKRIPKGKLGPIRKMKDHTEVISKLRNSVSIKDQVMAERMLHALELEQKIIQSFKDQDVLKKWRDKYRESQGQGLAKRNVDRMSSPLFRGEEFERLKLPPAEMDYITGDINHVINDLQKQLSLISTTDRTRDPENVMEGRKGEIKTMNEIMKKIAYLKQRC